MKNFAGILLALCFMILPLVSVAQGLGPLVPCDGPKCQACHLVQLGQNVLTWVITVMASVIAIVFAVAGFQMVTSGGDTGKVSSARSMMTDAVIGFIILLSAWLVIDTIMKLVVKPGAAAGGVQLGMWNSIQCVAQPVRTQSAPRTGGTTGGTLGTGPLPQVSTGGSTDISSRINSAVNSAMGFSTASGPANGRLACAWAVNNVLRSAGIAPIGGNNVQEMENVLRSGRGSLVGQSQANAGDIVIEAGSGHVGICQNSGCTKVVSNSSSKASFSWISGPDFRPSYSGGQGRIYRVNN